MEDIMKKIISVLIVLVLAFALFACDKDNSDEVVYQDGESALESTEDSKAAESSENEETKDTEKENEDNKDNKEPTENDKDDLEGNWTKPY